MNKLIKEAEKSRKGGRIIRQKYNRYLLHLSYRISFDINDISYCGHEAPTRLQKFKNYLKDTYITKNIDEVCNKFKFRPLLKRIKSAPEITGNKYTEFLFDLSSLKIT